MEERFGVKGTVCNDIFFTESTPSHSTVLKHIHVEISRQNSNLTEIKEKMAYEAKVAGANAIINFRYGQKKHQWWELIFTIKWDTESWHGEGDAVAL
jgi:hypothetical protein